ncbi:TetR/AcrR family transcriptional regulator [Gordonibacter pamelaeae]|uniref:TetR/AcrR family transcriptional regulator n=1 Tax=Gordonibacter pamelaeae TaxID=471189 RepID=UPI001D07F551|nr:TetR/AcrR family transcriptional regulator [Gordonibacter pamelaeae]MCB6313110.1 TetR/AcrR family transcriptional regulator [Gordonibacter pamelaeae]
MRDRDTKGRIVEAAFGLFAERGYHAVSVRDIAAAVGVKDASLYNHFPGKQAIFDAVLAAQLERTRAVFAAQGVMAAPAEDPDGYAGAFEETERRVLAGFRHFFADGDMVRLRRLLAASRYADEQAAEAFRFVFVEQPLAIQRTVFEHLMVVGQFAPDDAAALAREFYGPVFLLLLSDVPWEDAEPLVRGHLGRFFSAQAIGAPAGAAAEGGAR